PHGRYDADAENLCRRDPSVPGNDLALIIDQDRIAEAKLPDALGNLVDLLLGVGTRVVCVGPERFDRKHIHLEGGSTARDFPWAVTVRIRDMVLRGTRRVVEVKVAHGRLLIRMNSRGTAIQKRKCGAR